MSAVLLRFLLLVGLVILLSLVVLGVLRAQQAVQGYAARRAPGAAADARHERSLADARRRLGEAERQHERRVRAARDAVIEAGRDPVLATAGPVILGATTVTVRDRVHELSGSTRFVLDAGADGRGIFLTLTDDAWGDVVELPASDLEGARRLEVAGAGAVRNLDRARRERDERLRGPAAELERVRADTSEVDTARMTLEDLEGAPPRRIDPDMDPGIDPDEEPPPAQ